MKAQVLEIHKIVSGASSDILSDETIIKSLQNVQAVSIDIATKTTAAEQTEKQKSELRAQF